MEVVPKKFKYKQKKDNRRSTIEGVYTRGCVHVCGVMECTLTSIKNNRTCRYSGGHFSRGGAHALMYHPPISSVIHLAYKLPQLAFKNIDMTPPTNPALILKVA